MEPGKDPMPPTPLNDLPLETVAEILSRLPVKTLIRCTSVNKEWYSLIINPKFFAAQIRRSISSCDQNAVLVIPSNIVPAQSPCSLFSVETLSVIENFEVPFTTKTTTLKLAGSLNGLLCFTDATPGDRCRVVYLWNPSVRRHKTLVSSCFKEVISEKGRCVVGLGFHGPTDDYRLVRMFYTTDDEGNELGKVPPKVEIFSLRKNTWRKLKHPVVPRVPRVGGVFVNGCFYWLETKMPGVYYEDLWILSFDFDNEVFDEVKLPDKVRHCIGQRGEFVLMEFEGSVAVCVYEIIGSNEVRVPCCIWVMRCESGIVTWTIRFAVVMKVPGCPLDITKSGILIIESWETVPNCGLVSCNLKNMHYKNLGFGGTSTADPSKLESFLLFGLGGPSIVDTSFVESLLLLDGGNTLSCRPY